jgi:1-acyl-sn-glycerol-3-phosphate acyltransferase
LGQLQLLTGLKTMIFFLIFMATMVVTGIPTALLFIPWCAITGNVLPLYKGTRFMLASSCWMAGVRFDVEGIDRIPKDRACIFMANHVSNLDPPALISLIPGRTSAFMKRSLMELPILGTGFRQGDFIAVDRSGSPVDAERSVTAAKQVLAQRRAYSTTSTSLNGSSPSRPSSAQRLHKLRKNP